jgi:hypothetical protein
MEDIYTEFIPERLFAAEAAPPVAVEWLPGA